MRRGIVFGLIGVVVLAIVIFLVVALSGGNKKAVDNTLTIWSPFDEADTFNKISEQFLTDNPAIKLSYKYVQATDAKDYEARVVDAIANGNGPDIWLIRTDWLAKHQAKLVPSTSYVTWSKGKSDEAAAAEDFFGKAIADQNIRGGHLYGFPLSVDSLALYINTKVLADAAGALSLSGSADVDKLADAPATWTDVVTWDHLLTKKDSKGNITTAGIALGTTGNTYAPVDVFNAMLSQYGGSLFTDDEKSVALHLAKVVNGQSQTPGAQALTLFSSFAKPADPNYSWNATLGDPVNAFVDNKLAMMIGYSSLSQGIHKANKDFDAVKIVPLPQVDDPAVTGKRIDAANYWTLAVSKFSNKPATAWDYLKALGAAGFQKYGALTGKPSLAQVQDAPVKLTPGSLGETDLFAQQVSFAPAVFKPEWQATDQIVQDMLNQALLANQTPQAAVDSAAERLKALLQ